MDNYPFVIRRLGAEGLINSDFPNYRGIYRLGPPHIDHLSDDDPANRLFFWYCQQEEKHGGTDDIEKSRQLILEYQRAAPNVTLELLEVHHDRSGSSIGGEYLGTDLVNCFGLSVLAHGMVSATPNETADTRECSPSDALLFILASYLRSQLNPNGLMSSYGPAYWASQALLLAELPKEVEGCVPSDVYLIV